MKNIYAESSTELKKNFIEFIKEFGDRKVSNPNPKSRDSFPQVQVTTLANSKEGQEVLKKMFRLWMQDQSKNEEDPSSEEVLQKEIEGLKSLPSSFKPTPPPKEPFFEVSEKEIDEYLEKNRELFEEYEKIISKDLKYHEYFADAAIAKDILFLDRANISPLSKKEIDLKTKGMAFGYVFEDHIKKTDPAKFKSLSKYFGDAGWVNESYGKEGAEILGTLKYLGVEGYECFDDPDQASYANFDKAALDGKEELEEIIREKYLFTQAVFKYLDIKSIRLYRGVTYQIDSIPPDIGDELFLKTRELSSWSTSPDIAAQFGRVLMSDVPVHMILGGYITMPVYGSKQMNQHDTFMGEEELMVMESSKLKSILISD